jgi:plasmid stabilization system protein ParE
MAGQVIWSEEALDDVDAIAAYIARDSVTHARRFVSEVFDVTDLLVTQPRMGRMVRERGSDHGFREFAHTSGIRSHTARRLLRMGPDPASPAPNRRNYRVPANPPRCLPMLVQGPD